MFRPIPQADMSTLASHARSAAVPTSLRRHTAVDSFQSPEPLAKKVAGGGAVLNAPLLPALTLLPSATKRVAPWAEAASKILVVGVGGAGCNAVTRMVDQPTENFEGVRFGAANTDVQSLAYVSCDVKVAMGPKVTRGLGAGGSADMGSRAAEESTAALEAMIGDADLVFVTLGLGGGTGSGAAPVIARIARERGAVVVAVATMPFAFEGSRRIQAATAALEALRAAADTVVVVNNDALLSLFDKGRQQLSLRFAFRVADQCLQQAVEGIVGIIRHPGYINLDFADVRATLLNGGRGYFGTGMAEGQHAAGKAMTQALQSHLLGESGVVGAKKVLVYFRGDPAMELGDMNAAMALLNDHVDPDSHTIFGFGPDASLGERVEVTLFAVGVGMVTPPPVATAIAAPAIVATPAPVVMAEPVAAVAATASPMPVTVRRSTRRRPKPAPIPAAPPRPTMTRLSTPLPDSLPPFITRLKNKEATQHNYSLTSDQTDHYFHDDLDVPAFLRRRAPR